MSATILNLASALDHQARLVPDRPVVVMGPYVFTYGQAHALVQSDRGRSAGARARPRRSHRAYRVRTRRTSSLAYYAILKLGAVVVPLNVLLKPREIAYHLQDSDAKALLVFEGTPELPMAQMAQAALRRTPRRAVTSIVMTVRPDAPSPVAGAMTLGQLMHRQPTAFDDANRPRPTTRR